MLLLLAACARGGGRSAVDDLEPSGTTAPKGPLVVLLRYGGVAGTSERVTVDDSGQATVVGDRSPAPRTRVLSAGELANLRAALERSGMATLERNYLDPRAVDAYQYDVTYQGVTVTADEGVLPPGLRPVVDQLTKLLSP